MKKTILSLALALVLPVAAHAQESTPTCAGLAAEYGQFFSNATFSACSGFWGGNENRGGLSTGEALSALEALGYDGGLTNLGQWATGLGGNGLITGLDALGGETVIGIHWGSGNEVLKEEFGNGSGYGTVFFKFNNLGTSQLFLNDQWRSGYSNVALYKTGTPVPEPSTYVLMGAGLLGLGFVSRRRRKA